MGVFRQFPYSNFHEMNMDEIIKIVKNMLEEWAQYYAEWDAWMAEINDDWSNYQEVMNEAWQNMQNFINNYFDNLDVQNEINNKITSMVNSGEFGNIVAPYIPPRVTEWLTSHITQPVGVVIDTSLTVAGACADAKATGDADNSLIDDIDNLRGELTEYTTTYTSGEYVRTDGTIGTSPVMSASWYINVANADRIVALNMSAPTVYNAFYDSEYAFISAFTTENRKPIEVPGNAKFIRVSKPDADTNYKICKYPMTVNMLSENMDDLIFAKPENLDYVTPQMFGAVGDGIHDDTTAIQAALDSGFKRVIIPRTEKYYLVNDTINISNPSMIIEGSSGIDFGDEDLPCIKANSNKWTVFGVTDNAKFLQIKNLKIDCNNLTNAGIYHDRTSNNFINDLLFENVFVEDAIDYGVYLGAVYKSTFINVRTVHGKYGFILVGASNNYACTSCVFINCYTDYATIGGFALNNVVYSSMISCATDHSPIAYTFTKCKGLAIIGCGCERCGTAIFFADSDQNTNVVINGFTQLLDAVTSDYDATIYCGQVQNITISGLVWASSDHRPYLIKTTAQISSISVLDNSIPPAKCSETKKGQIRFIYRDIVYDVTSTPEVEGQIAVSNGVAYISVEENGSLVWKQISIS